MAEVSEIKGCPFCGRFDLQIIEGLYEIGFYVSCNFCEMQGPIGESMLDALDKWENRLTSAEIEKTFLMKI